MEKAAAERENSEESLMLQNLEPQENLNGFPMCLYEGFWWPISLFGPLSSFRKNFKAHDTDIVLASQSKAGTTWMKAILFSIVNRDRIPIDQSPLLTTVSHELIQPLECGYYLNQDNPDLENMAPQPPRLFATHLPYQLLASSLINSKCKLVYITRNPLDQFISKREFFLKIRKQWPVPVDQAFDMFCRGVHGIGPFWDHILGYWKASLENPDRILFLKYEDLKKDPISNLDKIAHFLGLPFSDEEREKRLIQEISNLCSFENLKNLQVNKTGLYNGSIINSSFYRKGEIGDWQKHLTPAMAQRLKEIMDEKMSGSGLNLDTFFDF